MFAEPKRQRTVESQATQMRPAERDDTPCGIAALTPDGVFLAANGEFCAQIEASAQALIGTDGQRALPRTFTAELSRHRESLIAGGAECIDFLWPASSVGAEIRYRLAVARDASDEPSFVMLVGTDLTATRRHDEARQRSLEQASNTQRLQSLQLLAGGIAHDFNNLLLGMIGHAELALLDLPPDHPARESLEDITKIGFRASDLCGQLLSYCGKREVRSEPLSLAELVESTVAMLRASAGGVETRVEVTDPVGLIQGDASQLRQVVVNLVTNAIEAMHGRPGAVTIRLAGHERAPGDLTDAVTGDPLPGGLYVRLTVEDAGCGMEPDLVARIFDPFFTTKLKGRGLGLATVMGVVHAHRGALTVATAPEAGTSVAVDLPAVASRATQAPRSRPGATLPRPDQPSRVLLVDDEAQVRAVSSRMLESAGYAVTAVADGYEALDRFGDDPDQYDLVVLDMTMPGISGAEALTRIRQYRAQVPVLLTSGFNQHEVGDLLARDMHSRFIQKPYTARALRDQVASMLAEGIQE